jgi:hypothetical protein
VRVRVRVCVMDYRLLIGVWVWVWVCACAFMCYGLSRNQIESFCTGHVSCEKATFCNAGKCLEMLGSAWKCKRRCT